MKAWVLHGIDDLRFENVETPKPAEGEVLVEVKAAGICGSDIPRIYKTGTYSFPQIPGHEFSGVVMETGSGVDSGWQGKRVGIFPLIPCKKCVPCQKKQYEMCRHYSYLGSRRDGGFAEYVTVPADNLIELPDSISFEAAAMLEPMAVAAHAMRSIAPTTEDTVVICGLGTIGLLLLMMLQDAVKAGESFAVREGSRKNGGPGKSSVLVIGNKEFQRKTVIGMGLSEDCYCDSRKEDVGQWLMERTDGIGADVFFECVGRNETVLQAIDYTAPAGRVMLMGNPYADMKLEKAVYWKILRNQLTVKGTWNSSFTHEAEDDWHYVLDRLSQQKIAPAKLISHRFPVAELEKGLHIMRDKTEDYVKIMGI
ncbi:MAG: galactitol-1-phosphate 5-dehydrogenase [Lachnospiraceae bacterium]|nr:galactitol-1-phosphate 5-dehydrogenase [Lachnospiraceae bacterium]